ncbi:hypothetical protein M8C21_013881, partial [Ambrosia artemisiifolia]
LRRRRPPLGLAGVRFAMLVVAKRETETGCFVLLPMTFRPSISSAYVCHDVVIASLFEIWGVRCDDEDIVFDLIVPYGWQTLSLN